MTVSNRGFRSRPSHNESEKEREKNSSGPHETLGNQRTLSDLMIPSDDVGNILDRELHSNLLNDNAGNSLDEEPAHLKSGILSTLQQGTQNIYKRNVRETKPKSLLRNQHNLKSKQPIKGKEAVALEPNAPTCDDSEKYMQSLRVDFLRLLSLKQGLPFSFVLRPINEAINLSDQVTDNKLKALRKLILAMLADSVYEAKVEIAKYVSAKEELVVFFVAPKSEDPVHNKDLIAALRQVVDGHIQKFIGSSLNVFLVLASAKGVMEDHLFKLGAKRLA